MRFAKRAKKVIAIEPEPKNIFTLEKRAAMSKNVCVVKKAAWSCKKCLKLYLSSVDGWGHSVVWRGKRFIEVEGDTLDNILGELGLEKQAISLMKINVEGAEFEILLGAKRCLSRTSHIIVQTHHRDGKKTTARVVQFLKARGFRVRSKIFTGDVEDIVYGVRFHPA
jgi:FkbM family methyltransferase